jgi:glycosyltransferase involved in cell wall biosynthesis
MTFSIDAEKNMSMRLITVGLLSPDWPLDKAMNGIVSYVDGLNKGLARLGHKAYVLASHCDGPNTWPNVYVLQQDRQSALARMRFGLAFQLNPLEAIRWKFGRALVETARRAITERGVELLEMEETLGLVQIVKRHLDIPVIAKLHGPHFLTGTLSGGSARVGFDRRIRHEGIAILKADAVSAPSFDVLERARRYYNVPLEGGVVIPNPAPIVERQKRWSFAECDPLRLLFVGRFDRVKGGDVVIDAFQRIVRRFPKMRLWFAGPDDGVIDAQNRRWSLAEYLTEKAPEVAECVDWLGKRPYSSLAELRQRAFISIVGSRYETFGMVSLEAMAHGCPLVATRVGGINEIVKDGVNGVLARPEDPDDLASGITRLLEAPEFASKLAQQAAEEAAQRYHPDTIARETAEFYREVIDRRTHRTRRSFCPRNEPRPPHIWRPSKFGISREPASSDKAAH